MEGRQTSTLKKETAKKYLSKEVRQGDKLCESDETACLDFEEQHENKLPSQQADRVMPVCWGKGESG